MPGAPKGQWYVCPGWGGRLREHVQDWRGFPFTFSLWPKSNPDPLSVGRYAICQFLLLWFSLFLYRGPAASLPLPPTAAVAEAMARGGQPFHIW